MQVSTGELGLCAAIKIWVDLGLCSILYSWVSGAAWDVVECLGHPPRSGGDVVQVWEILMQLPVQVSWDALEHWKGQQRFMSKQLNQAQLLTDSGAKVWFHEAVSRCPLSSEVLGSLSFTDFNRCVDPGSRVDTCIFTCLCLPILMLTEFFQKYMRNSDSAKSFICPIFRLTGHQLIAMYIWIWLWNWVVYR